MYLYVYIYIHRYIETVTSLPDRQCPEQGRCFFVVQDFVLGVIYIYIYIPGLCPWRVYMHIYIYIHQDFVLGGKDVYIHR